MQNKLITLYLSQPLRVVVAFFLATYCSITYAQQPPAQIKTYGEHVSGNIVYNYKVTNTGNRTISSFAIGYRSRIDSSTPSEPQLTVFPIGYDRMKDYLLPDVSQGTNSAPTGWVGKNMFKEATALHWFQWYNEQPSPGLSPGQTLNFSVTVAEEDRAYLTGHFNIGFGDGKVPRSFTALMEVEDLTPPTIVVNTQPNTLWSPNNKLVKIVADIAAQDKLDPNPQIKLESIMANETLKANDIQDAQLGTDDRQFSLVAKRAGTNQAGRIYTITYCHRRLGQ